MKTQSQENFPVASLLFPRAYREIIIHYYNFARYCDDIADNSTLSPEEKLKQLHQAEQALFGKENLACAEVLRHDFLSEKLDFSLVTDLLIAFRQDAQNIPYKTWAQLLDYCRYSAEPVGRFMLALFNENPSTYLPAAALCSVLQLTNHIQDLHQDITILNRIYLPEEMLSKYKVSQKSLQASECSKSLHSLLNDILKRCRDLLKDACILPAIVKSRRIKIYLSIILSLTDILINKLYNADVLAEHITLSKSDRIRAIIKGLWLALTTKHKTLTNQGL